MIRNSVFDMNKAQDRTFKTDAIWCNIKCIIKVKVQQKSNWLIVKKCECSAVHVHCQRRQVTQWLTDAHGGSIFTHLRMLTEVRFLRFSAALRTCDCDNINSKKCHVKTAGVALVSNLGLLPHERRPILQVADRCCDCNQTNIEHRWTNGTVNWLDSDSCQFLFNSKIV